MTLRPAIAFLALALAGGAAAGPNELSRIAGDAGLREREVRMLAGAPSAYAEYRTSYRRLSEQTARRGLDLRSLAVIERHGRELDRATALSMKVEARRAAPALVAAR